MAGGTEALRAAEAAAEARLAELGDVRKPAGAAAARLTEASAAASTKIARSLEPPPEEARFVVAALDRLGRLSPTEQQRALNSALLAAGGSDPEAKRNAVTLLQAARRLDDVPASLRTEISGTLRSALAPAEVAAEAEALADQANFVANVRRNAADTMAKLAREV